MRTRKTREEWAALVAAFERTKQPVERFCARRVISPTTFRWWRWKLRDTAPPPRRSDAVQLLSVDVINEAVVAPRWSSRVVIAISDLEVQVDVGADVTYVAALVASLRHP